MLKEDLNKVVLKINPPMEDSADKAVQSFLNLFKMEIYKKGEIIALEET